MSDINVRNLVSIDFFVAPILTSYFNYYHCLCEL